MQIVSRWDNKRVLWDGECDNLRDEVVAAVRDRASLVGARLDGARLDGARLDRARLDGANLVGASLVGASLVGASLDGARLDRANLVGASLVGARLVGASLVGARLDGARLDRARLDGASLVGASLVGASLVGARLVGASLVGARLDGARLDGARLDGANLDGARLDGANLAGATGINPLRCTPLLMLLDQPGPIRLYKLVTADGVGPYNGGITYEVGGEYAVENANTNPGEQCGAGINVATLDWCMREWRQDHRILVVEFGAEDIAAVPTATDGKVRLHRCRVVGEKDLVEIGLVDAPATDAATEPQDGGE